MATTIQTRFQPAWWLKNRHGQTLWPTLTRRLAPPPYRQQWLATPDGDILELTWCGHQGPVVILLHGLCGSYRSHYIQGLQWTFLECGWRSVCLNFRGCGSRLNRTARCYHSGETGDLDFVFQKLREWQPHTPIAAAGFSLGGNLLLKWLGERAGQLDLFAACAVSVPLQLDRCADTMDLGFARIYRNRLLGELKHYVTAKIQYLEQIGASSEAQTLKALGDLSGIRSFWEYDDRVIAGLYPFQDVTDYYHRCSSRQFLKAITVPTLLIQSRDDPFMSSDVIPSDSECSARVFLEITDHGGHVGFIQGPSPIRPNYWLEQRIPEFFRSQLAAGHRSAFQSPHLHSASEALAR